MPATTVTIGDTRAEADELARETRLAQVPGPTAIALFEQVWGRELAAADDVLSIVARQWPTAAPARGSPARVGPVLNKDMTDRAAGVLLGQACGDALGVPYEFATPPPPGVDAEMRGGGLGPYEPGEWSDDTQMALCVARVAATGADLRSPSALDTVAAGFEEWLRGGASDVGVQTRAVLRAADRLDGSPAQRLRAAAQAEHARTGRTAGNGALMRTAVVGLCAPDDRVATAEAARAVAELTHTDPLAGDSCVLWSEAVRVAVTEARFDVRAGLDLLPVASRDAWAGWIQDAEDPGATAGLDPNGFTVTALQAAWHAIVTTSVPDDDPAAGTSPGRRLERALHAAVRIGGDTDTVAAIAGGLLGARWGASAVPSAWRSVVHGWPGLRADDLVDLARSVAAPRPAAVS